MMWGNKLILLTYVLVCIINTASMKDDMNIILINITHDQLKFQVTVPNGCNPSSRETILTDTTFVVYFSKAGHLQETYAEPENISPPRYVIKNLEPEQLYLIKVYGCGEKNPFQKNITTACIPLKIMFTQSTIDSAMITFKKDLGNGYCKMSDYYFSLEPAEPIKRFEENYRISITNLTPNTKYTFTAIHNSELTYCSFTESFRTKPEEETPEETLISIKFLDIITAQHKYLIWTIQEKKQNINSLWITWELYSKSCANTSLSSMNLRFSPSEPVVIKLYPYLKYTKCDLDVIFQDGTIRRMLTKPIDFSTAFNESFHHEEKDVIENLKANDTSITVSFKKLNCVNQAGPLFLKYEVDGGDGCQSNKREQNYHTGFSFQANRSMTITDLSPSCTYKVTFFISRRNNDWKNENILGPYTVETKAAGTG